MRSSTLFIITSLLCFHLSSQQSTGEVVLDPQGITFDDFEVLTLQLAKTTFTSLTDEASDKQALATTFATNLALSVANLVIYVNNEGFQDVSTTTREISSVLEAALTSAVASSPQQFKVFDKEVIVSTVEQTVSDILTQLQDGKGINEVINDLANPVLQVSLGAMKRLIHLLEHPELAEVQKSGNPEPKSKTTNTTSVAKTFTNPQDDEVPEFEDSQAVQQGTVVYVPESGEFTFSGEGKAVSQLKEYIIKESEPGFVIMQNANQSDVPAVVKSFAANLTQIIGEVLLTVLNAEDDVDKETEAEAISDAVGSALLEVVENTSGNLKSLDVTLIQNEIVAAAFNAITASSEPEADIKAILQTGVEQVMETIENAFLTAMIPPAEEEEEGEENGELSFEHKDAVQKERQPEPPVSTNTSSAAATETPETQASNGEVVEVSSSSTLTFEEVQGELSSAFITAFTAVEEEPTASSTQTATKDLLYAIATAIGQTFVSLFPQATPEDQVQVVVGLLYGGIQAAVEQTTGPLSAFDVAGVIGSIQTGASEVFSSADTDLQTKLQELAGLAIDAIVNHLTELVPDFVFKAKVEFGSSSNTETSPDTVPEEDLVSAPIEEEPGIVAKSAVQAKSETASTTAIEPESAPLSTSEVVDTVSPEEISSSSCLCFDDETFEAVVDSMVESKIEQILKEKGLI
eukprot:TRINITY_DN1818_c0_g1_i1.p1 TRINITY_DN1818_c0_g1~~TRINITY_DN1818_c0_g1_i1.p1  ORF type:complete len:690 (+),score=152.36 TRINITY_DN1818_c0_g1_i1:135-2204(+)